MSKKLPARAADAPAAAKTAAGGQAINRRRRFGAGKNYDGGAVKTTLGPGVECQRNRGSHRAALRRGEGFCQAGRARFSAHIF